MKKLLELYSAEKQKRFRASIFVDIFAADKESADEQLKVIQSKIPNSYVGEMDSL